MRRDFLAIGKGICHRSTWIAICHGGLWSGWFGRIRFVKGDQATANCRERNAEEELRFDRGQSTCGWMLPNGKNSVHDGSTRENNRHHDGWRSFCAESEQHPERANRTESSRHQGPAHSLDWITPGRAFEDQQRKRREDRSEKIGEAHEEKCFVTSVYGIGHMRLAGVKEHAVNTPANHRHQCKNKPVHAASLWSSTLYINRFVGEFLRMNSLKATQRLNSVKLLFLFLSLSLLLIGCATSSTLQKRINERPAAYRSLSPEFKALVDQGQIKAGMPANAVYLAWGAPSEILRSGDARGEVTRWLYYGTYMQEFRYWTGSRGRGFPSAQLDHDYIPRDYVSAEVIFLNDVVKSWTMRPQPTY